MAVIFSFIFINVSSLDKLSSVGDVIGIKSESEDLELSVDVGVLELAWDSTLFWR